MDEEVVYLRLDGRMSELLTEIYPDTWNYKDSLHLLKEV